jgi:hypothetical protein
MDWGKVVESAIGTFTGGAIAVASMWLKELIDRWKSAQVWYEQFYITEGIDRLMSHVKIMEIQLALVIPADQAAPIWGSREQYPGVKNPPKSESHETYPLEALVRIETLLNDNLITALITTSYSASDSLKKLVPGSLSQDLMRSSHIQLRNLYDQLKTIRTELLKVKIRKKSDIKKVQNQEEIKQALVELRKIGIEWIAKSMELDQPIALGK